MENRLEVQEIQHDELYIELTPEELEELKELKGGLSSLFLLPSPLLLYRPFPNGVPAFPYRPFRPFLPSIPSPIFYR